MSQDFTLAELAAHDGREGRPAYAAVDGIVYDLSPSQFWSGGEHAVCDLSARAGRDLSDEITLAPSYMRSMLAGMPQVGTLSRPARQGLRSVRWGLAALLMMVIAVPFVAMGLAGFRSDTAGWVALRIAAMEAFSLLSVDIAVGGYRPVLTRVFRTKTMHRAHQWIGLIALALAIGHGTTVLTFGAGAYLRSALLIGPCVLALLVAIIAMAMLRRRASTVWRWIHRVNYGLFAAVLVHASYLGLNVRSQTFLRVVLYAYAAAVVAALGYRIFLLLRRQRAAAVQG
jgi:predicted heme/steroid binding protein